MSEILKDNSINELGNAMRMKRNKDFYVGGIFISEKESEDYHGFVKEILFKIMELIKKTQFPNCIKQLITDVNKRMGMVLKS